MNNPYARQPSTKKSPVSRREVLFAPEVYEEPARAPRRDRAEDLATAEIARLRAEMRGETRALRAAVNRPKKDESAQPELAAQLASLRSMVSELVASQGTQKETDAIYGAIAACGIEGQIGRAHV